MNEAGDRKKGEKRAQVGLMAKSGLSKGSQNEAGVGQSRPRGKQPREKHERATGKGAQKSGIGAQAEPGKGVLSGQRKKRGGCPLRGLDERG